MSTLERLETVEKLSVSAQAEVAKLQNDVNVVKAEVAKLQNDVNVVKAEIRSSLDSFSKGFNSQYNNVVQYLQFLMQKVDSVEKNTSSFGAVLTATLAELSEKDANFSSNVTLRIRRNSEDAKRGQVAKLVEQKTIELVDVASATSMVATSQSFLSKEGKTELLTEYETVELPSQNLSEEIRAKFVGKKAGDVVELEEGEGKLQVTVLAVYDLAQKQEEQVAAPAVDAEVVQK